MLHHLAASSFLTPVKGCLMPTIIPREQWLPIPGWPKYVISNRGQIKSIGSWCMGRAGGLRWVPGRILRPSCLNGRLGLTLCDPERKQETFGVAYLVLSVFVRPPVDGEIARHYHDPNPRNCCVENLRWG